VDQPVRESVGHRLAGRRGGRRDVAAQLAETLDDVGELEDLRPPSGRGPNPHGRLCVDLGIGSGTDRPGFADLDRVLVDYSI
jgi:hypothetical protein